MSFPFFVARRYCQSGAGNGLVHRIGLISLLSIALSTMALLLVLSTFNGLEDLLKSLFRSFDPDIKIVLKEGKSFAPDPVWMRQLREDQGVAKVVEVIEDNAMLRYGKRQIVAKVKGVSDDFTVESRLAPFIQQGSLQLRQDDIPLAILGVGIRHFLAIRLRDPSQSLQVLYPNNIKVGALMPSQLYSAARIVPGAIFSVERQFDDNYVIVPLDFAAQLMGMGNKRSALEVQVKPGHSFRMIQKRLRRFMPSGFAVLTRYEQQATLMRAIYIERLFVSLTLAFILVVASLNIFFVLSMLVMDKRRDIAVLYTLGATPTNIRWIFLLNGLMVALGGTIIGMATAWLLSWLQQQFGFITFGTETSLVDAYPVRRQLSDFVYTTIWVIVITFFAAYRPAQLASRTSLSAYL